MVRFIVGNDIVDLADPRCVGKASHGRFLARVLDPSEAQVVRVAENPDRQLWRRWAAKEAAYKVVSKVRGHAPVFEHRRFVVDLPHPADLAGRVVYESFDVPFTLVEGPGHVHALAWMGRRPPAIAFDASRVADEPDATGKGGLDRLLVTRFSPRERTAIHSLPSALVRLAARRAAAERMGLDPGSIEIVCEEGRVGRSPPMLLLDGRRAPIDVSLSHHGGWIAWAIAGPEPGTGTPADDSARSNGAAGS